MGDSYTRRDFVVRTGILGAVAALGWLPGLGSSAAMAQSADDLPLDQLGALLRELARDTFDGFASMVVPGPDPYSVAQGVTSPRPGAIAARASSVAMDTFDRLIPLPDLALANIAVALAVGMSAPPVSLPPALAGLPASVTDQLDEALRSYTENDQPIPVSVIMALVLNQAAVAVDPAAVSGPFLSPFARLSYGDKLAAMAQLEGATADVVATVDAHLPEPETGSAAGLIRFAINGLFAIVNFGSYGEHAVLDPVTRQLIGRPVGWEATGYQPDGPVAGWAELRGYFHGHRAAD
ncbi:MAG: twin-arginine translocation signal domain-containing protein [Acidimicrobiales bacterium]